VLLRWKKPTLSFPLTFFSKNSVFDRGSIGKMGLCVKKVIRTRSPYPQQSVQLLGAGHFFTPREPQLISLAIEIWVTYYYPKAKTIQNRDYV
jgi:hypothetical protein